MSAVTLLQDQIVVIKPVHVKITNDVSGPADRGDQRAEIVNETIARWWVTCSRHGRVKVFDK